VKRREAIGADVDRRVEAKGCCPLANRSALPTSVMVWAAHFHHARKSSLFRSEGQGSNDAAAPTPLATKRHTYRRSRPAGDRMLQAAVMPLTQIRQSKTAYLAFGLCASEFVDCRSCLFGRLEHGTEPTLHL
jgi:hypothetical protein